MIGRLIRDQSDLQAGLNDLVQVEPRFAPLAETYAPLPLRLKPEGFGTLLSAIVGQQVSVASAEAVWAKLVSAGFDQPDAVLRADDDALRICGLSRQKIRYARALAQADIDYDGLRALPDADVLRILTGVTGIGTWTAEIYLMFSLGRADAFAAGDLAIQIAVQEVLTLDARPTEKALRQIAEPWAPWRSVAARLMWSYYLDTRQREGIR